jgi:hypothetical protein
MGGWSNGRADCSVRKAQLLEDLRKEWVFPHLVVGRILKTLRCNLVEPSREINPWRRGWRDRVLGPPFYESDRQG